MIINRFSEEKVLCITNENYLTYSQGYLKLYSTADKQMLQKCRLFTGVKSLNSISRLLRKEPRCATVVDSDTILISFDGKVLKYSISLNNYVIEHYYDKGMNNPLRFCTIKDPLTGDTVVYYGEYIWNVDKGPVAIYMRKAGTWKKVFEFPSSKVQHIHNIIFDEKNNHFYILTGDTDEESGIWISDIDFLDVRPLVKGSQRFRACVAFPTDCGLIYATDTPLEDNYIMELDITHNQVQTRIIQTIPGPCIYGDNLQGLYFFATSVEPDSSLSSWRYKFTYKLGNGVKERKSHIIVLNKDHNIVLDCSEKKDMYPIWLFQFGNFMFPYNSTNNVLATTQALKIGHNKTISLGVF